MATSVTTKKTTSAQMSGTGSLKGEPSFERTNFVAPSFDRDYSGETNKSISDICGRGRLDEFGYAKLARTNMPVCR